MGQIFITYYIIINLIFKNMKKITILASLALAFVTLTANATDKFFYKIATDKDPGWTIQDAGNFEGTPGKEYYQAYNKKNGGRMLNFAYPESAWDGIDLDKLPNKTYKWSMDLNMSTMATRSDMELTVLPVGTSLSDRRNSSHNYHWANKNEGEDFFFRFRVVTAPTEANGDFTILINESPVEQTTLNADGTTTVTAADKVWPTTTNPDSLCTLKSNVKYTFAVEVNTETNVATYTILNGETVVKTGTHAYVCDDRIGVQTLSMNGTSVHQLSNMGLSYFVDGVIAENPSVDLFWVEGTERNYFAQFKEGEILHWKQLGNLDQDYVDPSLSYTNGEEYSVEFGQAKEGRNFEGDPDTEGGQKIITCTESGTLLVWTTREDDETNKSDVISIDVVCEVENLPVPEAIISNVSEGYGKEYTLKVDNSNVTLKPSITIVYELTENGKTTKGEAYAGDKIKFSDKGSLKLQSADLTHVRECYGRSEEVIVENNTEYSKAVFANYAISKEEAEGTKDGFTKAEIVDNSNKSHWDRIYSTQSYGKNAEGAIVVNDGTSELTEIKTGFGFYDGSAIGTDNAKWPVQQLNTESFATAVAPLVIEANEKTDATWYLFPLEGLVSYQTGLTNVPVTIDTKYTSDDANKPNFYVVHTIGGYDRPDKGDCNAYTVVVAGEAYSLYRYDTAIKDVTVYTYKGFVEGSGATSVAAPKAVVEDANAPIYTIGGVKVSTTIPGKIYIQNGKKFLAK
jgi:hypothetical protein